jgi:hypothetical protein
MSEKVKNKLVFTTKDNQGNTLELAVKRPDVEQSKELQKIWFREYNEALNAGAPLRAKINDIARKQNLWDDDKEEEFKKLQKELFANELKLKKGGNAGLTKNGAKEVALRMREIRQEIQALTSARNEIESRCAESLAETAKFSHAVALCTVNPTTGDKYFKNYEDFKERESEVAATDAARYLALLTFNLDPNYENNLPENKFLKDYGFVDEKLRFINKEGKLVDSKGRLIREDGRFINEKGELVDGDGIPVDEEGNYKVDFAPFLKDEDEEDSKEAVKKK